MGRLERRTKDKGKVLDGTCMDTSFFKPIEIDSVEGLQKACIDWQPIEGWAFRGHRDPEHGLQTSLTLACERHAIREPERPSVEALLLRDFSRKAHLYTSADATLPHPADTLEWMSLLRHYGGPTRLLDWTYSIFVAAYFALDCSAPTDTCHIWAINAKWLNDVAAESAVPGIKQGRETDRDKTGDHFRRFFMPPKQQDIRAFVSTANPYRLNGRLSIQHGVFLCPGDVRRPFMDNLTAMNAISKNKAFDLQIRGSLQLRREITQLLYSYNINSEVLFPGMQGLALALRDRIPNFLAAKPDFGGNVSWLGSTPRTE